MKVFHEDERGLFIWTGRQKQRVKVIGTNGQEVKHVADKRDRAGVLGSSRGGGAVPGVGGGAVDEATV